jgi:CHAT domain-containing protein/Tfp pilus assembly protein PilF
MKRNVFLRASTTALIVLVFAVTSFSQINPPQSHFQLAMNEAERGNFGRAIELLKLQIRDDSTFAEPFVRLAEFYRYAGNLTGGQAYFREGLLRSPNDPNLQVGLASIESFLENFQQTFEHSRLALEYGASAPEGIELLVQSSLQNGATDAMQTVLRRLKKNASQTSFSDLGVALWRFQTGNLNTAASSLRNFLNTELAPYPLQLLGDVYLQSSDSAAVYVYLQALRLSGNETQWRNSGLMRRLGVAYLKNARSDSANYYLDRSLLLATKFADLQEQLEIHTALVSVYRELQRPPWIINSGARAIELATRLKENDRLSDLYSEVADAFESIGDHPRAIENHLLCAAASVESKSEPQQARAYNEIGRLLTKLLRGQQATHYLNLSLEIAQRTGADGLYYSALMNIADLKRRQGHNDDAQESYSRVLRYAQDNNQHGLAQTCLLKLANLHLRDTINENSAAHYLVLADAAAKQTLNMRNAANIRWMQGRLSLMYNDIEKAETYFLDAVQLGREIGSRVSMLAGNAGLISSYLSAHFWELAAARADSAIDLLENLGFLYLQDPNADFFDLRKDLFIPAITAYSRLQQNSKIYYAIETLKAYQHIQEIAPIRHVVVGFDPQLPDSVRWQLDDLSREINRKWDQIWTIWRSDNEEDINRVTQFKKEINALRDQHLRYRQWLAEAHPAYRSLMQPVPEPLGALQRRLADLNCSLIHYLVAENSTDIVVVTPDSVFHERVTYSPSYLENLVMQISPACADGLPKSLNGNGSAEEESQFRIDLAGQLYKKIFEPIRKWLPENCGIIVSADGVLERLPLETLVVNGDDLIEYKNAHFLLQDYSVAYVPYAKFLDWGYQRHPRKQKSLAAFSGPTLERAGNNHHNNHRNGATNLPDIEAREIANLVGNADHFTNEDSNRERFLSKSPFYNALHMAAPAVLEDGASLNSKFRLMGSSAGNDSVECREIFDLKMTADLAVLSQVAFVRDAGAKNQGQGMHSLLHALNFAGVSAAVISMWEIAKPEKMALLANFYSNLKAGQNTAEAMRQAKLAMIAAGNYNPMHWAGLVVSGTPTPVKFEPSNVGLIIVVTILGVLILATMIVRHYYGGTHKGEKA